MTLLRRVFVLYVLCPVTLSLLPALSVKTQAAEAAAKEEAWSAGTAKAQITPAKSMWMSGYGGRNHPSEGKLTELWAKALVLRDAKDHQAVVITLDLVGIDRSLSQSVCGQLKEKYGLERHQIAICTSHTHTGPVVGQNLAPLHYLQLDKQQQELVDQYEARLREQLVTLVGKAIEDVAPASLRSGSGTATFAVNRRNNKEADVPKLREQGALKGPVDHDVPVLAVYDAKESLKAVLFGYACHSTVLSFYQWSGDYPGFAQIALEEKHPGCLALFWAGCGADQNPLPRRQVAQAKSYGQRLATAVDQVLAGKMQPVAPRLQTDYREVALQLDTLPSREDLEKDTESTNRFAAARARMLIEKMDKDGKLSPTYPYPVEFWTLGDEVEWVLLGGEVVVDFALRIKLEGRQQRTWVAGYSNDVMAYIPSRRVLREGGYEGGGAMVYYGLPTVWSANVERQIIDAVSKQREELGGSR